MDKKAENKDKVIVRCDTNERVSDNLTEAEVKARLAKEQVKESAGQTLAVKQVLHG